MVSANLLAKSPRSDRKSSAETVLTQRETVEEASSRGQRRQKPRSSSRMHPAGSFAEWTLQSCIPIARSRKLPFGWPPRQLQQGRRETSRGIPCRCRPTEKERLCKRARIARRAVLSRCSCQECTVRERQAGYTRFVSCRTDCLPRCSRR